MSYLFYDLANTSLRLVLRALTRWEVVGRENVPREGPLILVANHLSHLDPPLLGTSLPRRIVFMAKRELFSYPVLGWVIRAYRGFPVRRGAADLGALHTALDVLRRGEILGVFPEGTRSRTRALQRGHPGAVLLARHAGVPLLPVGIAGSEVFPSLGVFFRPRIRVNVGEPFLLPPITPRPTAGEIERLADLIMHRIAELLPQSYRGVYATRGQVAPDSEAVPLGGTF